jgi:hypothetical protein
VTFSNLYEILIETWEFYGEFGAQKRAFSSMKGPIILQKLRFRTKNQKSDEKSIL